MNMRRTRLNLLLAVFCAVCATPVHAQTVDHDSSAHQSTSGHESAHEPHKNVLSFFVGVTHTGRRENGAALNRLSVSAPSTRSRPARGKSRRS